MVLHNAAAQSRDSWPFNFHLPPAVHRRVSRIPLFWRYQIGGWLLYGALTMPMKASLFGSVSYAFLITLFREPLAFLITAGYRKVFLSLKIGVHQPVRLVLWVVGLGLLGGALDYLFIRAFDGWIQRQEGSQSVLGIFFFRSMLFCCWSFVYFWIRGQMAVREHLAKLAQAKAAARDAELLMLRAQVAPHFLFNSLNTILAGLEREPLTLAPVVQGLADYFRHSLTNRHDALIPIGEEFDAIVNYLTVEKARFRDALLVECRIDPQARRVLVPGVFLQPLVENALKYGYQTSATPLRIGVSATGSADGGLVVAVSNSGKWVEPLPDRGSREAGGHGLAILRRRLELLYRGQAVFEVVSPNQGDGVTVQIRIPAVEIKPSPPI